MSRFCNAPSAYFYVYIYWASTSRARWDTAYKSMAHLSIHIIDVFKIELFKYSLLLVQQLQKKEKYRYLHIYIHILYMHSAFVM